MTSEIAISRASETRTLFLPKDRESTLTRGNASFIPITGIALLIKREPQ